MMRKKTSERPGGRERSRSDRREGGPRDRMRNNADSSMVKKRSHFLEGIKTIASDDYELLRKFVTEHGKIVPARLTGATSKQQRRIKRAVQRARVMGLLP
jgi:small subunit ribosomal protein S18